MFGIGKKKEMEREIKEEMKEQKENQLKWYHYLISLLFVLVGAVFIGYVNMDISFICKFFAAVFAAAGIISIGSYCIKDVAVGYYRLDLVYGVLALFAALIFFTKQDVVGVYFPVIVGFILFGNGVVKLQHSIDMKRIDRKMKKVTEMWLVVMIFALACIAAGSVAVYLTPVNERTRFLFIGISLVVAGVTDVFTHIVFNRKVRLLRNAGEQEETGSEEVTGEAGVETETDAETFETEGTYSEEVSEQTTDEAGDAGFTDMADAEIVAEDAESQNDATDQTT